MASSPFPRRAADLLLASGASTESTGARKAACPLTRSLHALVASAGLACLVAASPAGARTETPVAPPSEGIFRDARGLGAASPAQVFAKSREEFILLARNHVAAVLKQPGVFHPSERALAAGIARQKQLAEEMVRALPPASIGLVRAYQANLDVLRELLPATRDIVGMDAFWKQMNHVLVARAQVEQELDALDRRTGRGPAKSPDPGPPKDPPPVPAPGR